MENAKRATRNAKRETGVAERQFRRLFNRANNGVDRKSNRPKAAWSQLEAKQTKKQNNKKRPKTKKKKASENKNNN